MDRRTNTREQDRELRPRVLNHLVQLYQSGECVDPMTGEAELTHAAEQAAWEFDAEGWLDDESHWIWELSIEAAQTAKLRCPGDR